MRKFRGKIENSRVLAKVLGGILAGYLKICFATGRWTFEGDDALNAALSDGPVVIICWHGRLIMAPANWKRRAPVAIPRDPSPAGKLSAATQEFFGTSPFAISMEGGNLAIVRQVIKRVRDGFSLGLTADGPEGPDHRAKRAAIDWARATGRPVFLFSWSSRKARQLSTWDKMLLPLPFGGGACVYRPWNPDIPKRPSNQDYTRLKRDLSKALDDLSQRVDDLSGRKKDR